jgi:hypothetical protein
LRGEVGVACSKAMMLRSGEITENKEMKILRMTNTLSKIRCRSVATAVDIFWPVESKLPHDARLQQTINLFVVLNTLHFILSNLKVNNTFKHVFL